MHLLVLLAIVFFLFGAKRLPELGKSLGSGIHSFRNGIAGLSDQDEELPAAAPDEPHAIETPVVDAEGETAKIADGETAEAGDGEIARAGDGEIVEEGEIVETGETVEAQGETVAAGSESEQRAAS